MRLTERLFDFLAGSDKSQVYKGGHPHTRDSPPTKLGDELEREEEEVNPNSPSIDDRSESEVLGRGDREAYCLKRRDEEVE